jgi:hypothetical protein
MSAITAAIATPASAQVRRRGRRGGRLASARAPASPVASLRLAESSEATSTRLNLNTRRQPSMAARRSRGDARQVVFPPRRCERACGDAFRFIAVMRSALSVFTWVGLRRVDFRDGRAEPEPSSS